MRHLIFKVLFTVAGLLLAVTAYSQSSEQFRSEFLNRINRVRQQGCNCGGTYMPPAAPIVWNNQLEDAAYSHAGDMAKKGYFSHDSQDGRTSEDRIVSAGYQFKGFKSFAVGENIAEGQQSIAEVSDGWFKSPGHCKNLMNPEFKEIGIARYNLFWVQDFGGRTSFTAAEQNLIKSGRYKLILKKRSD